MADKHVYKLAYYVLPVALNIIIASGIGYCCTVLSVNVYIIALITLSVTFFFVSLISVAYVYENRIVIKHPLRFFHRVVEISYRDCITVLYTPMITKASAEQLIFISKDHMAYHVDRNTRIIKKEILQFFESKGLRVEVLGTYNNSINDLK